MSEIAIRVHQVSKKYRIDRLRNTHRTLRDTLAEAIASPFRRASRLVRRQVHSAAELTETIWALRGVSLEVERGEVLGIIGRNGAGKSTLLKILTRITEPTEGRAEIRGRVGSLLEVGTGFHPELTGRENTYLNGAILGMKQTEIDRKFDEIVAFAEIEKFIDTPVKHYSSGMYTRLAFAVAAHLEPEVLIVDEVLAVGDARFQKKCLGKMEAVGKQGRTVLFVSHNPYAVVQLCQRVILLEDGKVAENGPAAEVMNHYLGRNTQSKAEREWPDLKKAPGKEIVRLCAVRVRNDCGEVTDKVDIRRSVTVEMEYEVLQPGYVLLPNLHFHNEEGHLVFQTHDLDPAWRRRPRPAGRYVGKVHIPGNLLAEGTLSVTANMTTVEPNHHQFWVPESVAFQLVDPRKGDSARGDYPGPMRGAVRPLLEWTNECSIEDRSATRLLVNTPEGLP